MNQMMLDQLDPSVDRNSDFDVRVLVLGGKVLASMRRDVIKGDFQVKLFTEAEKLKCLN